MRRPAAKAKAIAAPLPAKIAPGWILTGLALTSWLLVWATWSAISNLFGLVVSAL